MSETRGPVMLAATSVLKQAPARVSRIAPGIQLPRTVPIKTLLTCLAGAVLSVLFVSAVVGFQLRTVLIAGVLGGAGGWFLVTYQPLEGETLLKWFGLSVSALKDRRREVDGRRARAYVGICPVDDIARGALTIVHGHADVVPGSVDERGGIVPPELREVGLLDKLGRREEGGQ